MLFHKSTVKGDRIAHMLCINMYVSLFIGCAIVLDIYCYTLYGHLYINVSFDGQWCYIKAYLFYVSGCGFFYSYLLQAIYRLCRIVLYRKPALQSFRLYVYGIIFQWILSFIQVIPVFLLQTFEYLPHDYHCQIAIHNIRGLLIGLSLVHTIPISLTTISYVYTMIYIRKVSAKVKTIRQLANDRRDFLILKRIFIVLTILIASGMPAFGIGLYVQFSGHLPFWSTQFQWFSATFSMLIVSVILIFISPNLRKIRNT
ncbi:hypothetical protein I4U23_008021 [Adineta vaga]|nr:hypothetical protein I4U23_008021 [Adineta vaga]